MIPSSSMESLFHKWLSNDRVGYVFTGCDPKLQLVTVAISKIGRQSYPEKKIICYGYNDSFILFRRVSWIMKIAQINVANKLFSVQKNNVWNFFGYLMKQNSCSRHKKSASQSKGSSICSLKFLYTLTKYWSRFSMESNWRQNSRPWKLENI